MFCEIKVGEIKVDTYVKIFNCYLQTNESLLVNNIKFMYSNSLIYTDMINEEY